MYLICYGTRPEIIKLFPLIRKLKDNNIPFLTLFSGQHKDLYKDFENLVPIPDYVFENIMEDNQTLNRLSSKILGAFDEVIDNNNNIKYTIVQGDTTTAYSIALASFHRGIKVIHLEAGLRTYDKLSPFPEEMNRRLISNIADIHLCPTKIAINNLKREGITDGVYLVGNTVVDSFKLIENDTNSIENEKYFLVTLHRRENRGVKMRDMWNQLNKLSNSMKFIYIIHPSLKSSKQYLSDRITKLQSQDYVSMVNLIRNCEGLITDSGGLQEEAVCAGKRVLVCRDITERPETIESGWGLLVGTDIENNICFLNDMKVGVTTNPYGTNVCDKIVKLL